MNNTKQYCVLGYPIGHSKSPEFQNRFFNITGYAANYTAVEMPPEKLSKSIDMLISTYNGFNCTVPLKQQIIPYLDYIDPVAKLCGSVNTVKVADGKLLGYTTDGLGLIKALEFEGVLVDGKKILITGSGGVARAILFACAPKCKSVMLAARNIFSARELADSANEYVKCEKVSVCDINNITGSFDILIQCTPVGMHPDTENSVVGGEVLKNVGFVFDTVYNPPVTKIVKTAREIGVPAVCGFNMLLMQGVASQEIWRDCKFSPEDIQKLIEMYRS